MTNKIREGFTENTKNPYKEMQKQFADVLGRRIQWPNNGGEVDFSKEMNEAIDNYQKLYCLKKGTPDEFSPNETNWNFGEQKKEGEDIGPLAGTGNAGGLCKKPPEWKIEHGDKVLKNGNNHWYVNKYGYIKKINPSSPLCTQKDVIKLSEAPNKSEYLEYSYSDDQMQNYSSNSHIQACDSGNYNLEYCSGDICQHAYLSPSGKLKQYGDTFSTNKSTRALVGNKGIKGTACEALPIHKSLTKDNSAMSFTATEKNVNQWGGHAMSSADFSGLGSKDFSQKTNAVMNCYPYMDGNISASGYKTNLGNKINSDIKLRWIEEAYVKGSNDYLDLHNSIKGRKREMLDHGGHATANKYMAQMKKLKELRAKLEGTKDYTMTITKINSEQMHRWMWVGSAVALGAISLKLISGI